MPDGNETSRDAWPYRYVRGLLSRLVRLFYARTRVQGAERIPDGKPVIFVLNHPNGLLDPMLLMVARGGPVAFLAKSTLFANPLGRFVMDTFGALPVYRQRDADQPGGPSGDLRSRNEETFARCRALLRRGRALALFPEGATHSGAQLLPLRTGAARIALGAEAEAGWTLDLHVVPVGLWYEEKTRFRSSVLLVVGHPFMPAEYGEAFVADERSAVQAMTARIEEGLDEVVLQAEHAELLEAIPVVAGWTTPDISDPGRRHAWTATLLEAYGALQRDDPGRLDAVAERARRYAGRLQALGIENPWQLERPPVRRRHVLARLAWLAVLAPAALAGFLMSYGPYRLAGSLATRVTRNDTTQTGTAKLMGGSLFVLIGWIVEALACGWLFDWPWGVAALAAAPPLGYAALRWGEEAHRLRKRVTYNLLRLRRERLVDLLVAERQGLARDVRDAVAVAGGSPDV